MIVYINGNLGSGKTSLAVAFLYAFFPNKTYDNFKGLSKKFFPNIKGIKRDKLKIYTNISGFKFEDFDGKAEFLNFDILSECSKIHYELHLTNKSHKHIDKAINSFFDQCSQGVEFDDLQSDLNLTKVRRKYNFIKGFQFNHIILMIDEVADYFVANEPHLDKWFNYSRHLYQDMILIQNDLSSIDKAYKNDNVVTNYIRAAEPENRLHPQLFKYAFFKKWTQPATDKPPIKMFWLPKWIFDKYDSGQIEKTIPKIYYYLVPFLILLFSVVYQIFGFLSPNIPIEQNNSVAKEVHQIHNNDVNSSIDDNVENNNKSYKDKSIICFRCRSNTCLYNNDIYSFNRIKAYIKVFNFEFIYKDVYPSFSNYCFLVDNSFFELNRPKSNQNNSLINNNINTFNNPIDEATHLSAKPQR